MTVAQALMTVAAMWIAMRETGAASPVRMFAAVLAGLAAMGAVGLALGSGFGALLASLVAYAALFLAVEWLLHGDDLALFLGAFREGATGVRPKPPG
jgi:hypothetical protein